jgi:4-amino-4-deoxy-L-arabinose transferase-like glycosyltransferase
MTQIQRFPYLFLFLICTVIYSLALPHLPVTDRDEGRFVQATKQMLETDEYLTIKFQDEYRNKKPAGIYWLQSLAVKAIGQDVNIVWPYRLPSLFAAILAVLLTYFFACRLFDSQIALLAALFLASSPILMAEATTAKTDAMLLLCTLSAMGLLSLGYQDQSKNLKRSFLLGCSLAAGFMIKGPMTPFFFGATIVGLLLMDKDRSWLKNFHWPLVLLIPAVIVIPWFLLIQKATGGQFAQDSLKEDFLKKIISAQEGHGAPPGFYLVSLLIGLWSCALWLFPSLKKSWSLRTQNKSFTFCWATLLAWPFLELAPTKLIHYPLPLYPWIAMLTAWGVFHYQEMILTKLFRFTRAVWLFFSFLIAVAFFVITLYVEGAVWPLIYAGVTGALLFWGALVTVNTPLPKYPIIAAFLTFASVFSLLLPNLSNLWVTEKIYQSIKPDLTANKPMILIGYGEPSAVFRLGTQIVLSRKALDLEQFITQNEGHIFIEQNYLQKKHGTILTQIPNIRLVGEISGINYNKMKPITLKHYILAKKE